MPSDVHPIKFKNATEVTEFKPLNVPNYALSINPIDWEDGVSVMSFVKKPAVDKDFIALSEEGKKKHFKMSFDEDKRVVTGVALRANYPIYRKEKQEDGTFKHFTFTISPEEIEKVVTKFMREGKGWCINIEHDDQMWPDSCWLWESYILSEDVINTNPAFADVEVGSWMVSYKIDNPDVWELVKSGVLRGFSVEIEGTLTETNPEIPQNLQEIISLITLIETT